MPRKKKPYRLRLEATRSPYWQYQIPGMKSFRSTGLTNERAAKSWIEKKIGIREIDAEILFGDFAAPYFTNNCPYTNRQIGRGKNIKNATTEWRLRTLEIHVMPRWENIRLCDLSPIGIESWISELDYSSQTKAHILSAMKIVLNDAHRQGILLFSPSIIERPIVTYKEKTLLDDESILKLFDKDLSSWTDKRVGILCALLFSGGLRGQDARALTWDQIHPEYQGLIVDKTIDSDGNIAEPKGGNSGAVLLPIRTMDMIMGLEKNGDFVFHSADGGHASRYTIIKALYRACDKAGVIKTSPHGLKHSYTTRIGRIIPDLDIDIRDIALKEFTRHKTKKMAKRYFHDDYLKDLKYMYDNFKDKINQIWPIEPKGENNGEN